MKSVRLLPTLIVLLVTLPAAAKNYEYISLDEAKNLEKNFKKSATPSKSKILGSNWVCDMYGMRTRFQVERGLNLYSFGSSSSKVIKNSGTQMFGAYSTSEGGLFASRGPLKDIIRVTDKGQLISEMSIANRVPEAEANAAAVKAIEEDRIVIAYTLCEPLKSSLAKSSSIQ